MHLKAWIFIGSTLLPTCALADGVNPFAPLPGAQSSSAPAHHAKTAASASSAPKAAKGAPVVLPAAPELPPLLPPLPGSMAPSVALTPAAPVKPGHKSPRSCVLSGLPEVPHLASGGGTLTITVPESTGACIAGVQTESQWVHIQLFNGRELHLQIDPNLTNFSREAVLVFASLSDSRMLHLSQVGSSLKSDAEPLK